MLNSVKYIIRTCMLIKKIDNLTVMRRPRKQLCTRTISTSMALLPYLKRKKHQRLQVSKDYYHDHDFVLILKPRKLIQCILYVCIGSENPNVVSVFLSKEHKLHTTRSWEFLGLEKNGRIPANSAWRKARFGENIIIANIDTGMHIAYFFFQQMHSALVEINIYQRL